MDILTGAEMREADRRTIHEVGVPGRVLMESAGRGVAGAMEANIDDLSSKSIVIVCGKGNNGGDGLVLLRTLVGLDYDARAFVLAPFEELAPDALDNLQSALKLELPVDAVTNGSEWDLALQEIDTADVIVDAILGTGLESAVRGLPAQVIDDNNLLETTRVSIDLPSGLSADTGAVFGTCVNADLTVALAAPKVCHYVSPACEHCGTLEVVEIGIPPMFLECENPGLSTIEPESMLGSWPSRMRSAHKGDFGHLLVVAGSVGKTGAALMTAEAALRAGVGLVTIASARSAIPMMAPRLPEAMWEPLPETSDGAIAFDAAARVSELLADRSALALGPGLGLDDETVRLVHALVSECRVPTVVDADGLNALQGHLDIIPTFKEIGLTPHPGEAARLLNTTTSSVQDDRLSAARELASRVENAVLLKGYRSLIANPGGDTIVNLTGNPGLATAGSGDVLTGIVGGMLAQGASVSNALVVGAYVHGLAGDLAAAELGGTSLIATDIISKLGEAIHSLGAD
jgi:hydroxyethylthiazole kinase-like uncharacterized protein yjeF